MSSQDWFPLGLVSLHGSCVENRQVSLAGIQELFLMQPIFDHVLVVPDLQVLEVICFEQFRIHFFADDLCSNVILFQEHQPHLVQYVLGFFAPLHGTEGLHLHFLQEIRGLLSVALVFFHLGQHFSEPRLLHLNEDFSLCDLVQCADQVQLCLFVKPLQPAHHQVDHVCCRPLQLAPLLGQEHNVLLQFGPVLNVKIRLANLAQQL
mmetsp:Transcript_75904/g.197714  ORF Transcript_75904/g.197714 Transcript_75904/m.197714 type:complete len:206 (-) Transcript_75904:327-944(-)